MRDAEDQISWYPNSAVYDLAKQKQVVHMISERHQASFVFYGPQPPFRRAQTLVVKTDKIEKVRAVLVHDCRSEENQDPNSFLAALLHSDQTKAGMRSSTPCVVVKFSISIEVGEWEVQRQQDVSLLTDTDFVRDCLLLEGNMILLALKRKRVLILNEALEVRTSIDFRAEFGRGVRVICCKPAPAGGPGSMLIGLYDPVLPKAMLSSNVYEGTHIDYDSWIARYLFSG